MTAKPFAARLAEQRRRAIEQADHTQDARALLTAKYESELAKYLTDEGELRGKALATPPQETSSHVDDGCLDWLRKERGEAK